MPALAKKTAPLQKLEEQYVALLRQMQELGWSTQASNYSQNLEQPSPLRVVETVTTYGAYEKPF